MIGWSEWQFYNNNYCLSCKNKQKVQGWSVFGDLQIASIRGKFQQNVICPKIIFPMILAILYPGKDNGE